MFYLRRRSDLARSLDQTIKIETAPIQVRDTKHRLIFTVSGSIHATYKIIDTRKFIHHFPDIASCEAHLKDRLAVNASTVMGEALSDKDRSEFAKASTEIGRTVKQQLSAFFDEYGIKLFSCSCVPVVTESAKLDDIEWKGALKESDPILLLGELLRQTGAGTMSSMSPAMQAMLGQAMNPTPQRSQKDIPLI